MTRRLRPGGMLLSERVAADVDEQAFTGSW